MLWFGGLLGLILLVVAASAGWRAMDRHADKAAWMRLTSMSAEKQGRYDSAMAAELPEPARRFFNYTIQPGTSLQTVVEIKMNGELGLGSKKAPNYKPMQACQILAPPYGLVWKLKTGAISGSDGALPKTSWTRFWLFGLVPIVRASGPDHHRSAFGRVVAEGAFWAPASLLPSQSVRWEPIDDNTARAIVSFGGYSQNVDITVNADGQPARVVIQRWSSENPDKVFREQPFGGVLSDFRDVNGYRLPFRVEGGNHIGTEDYFPFFKAHVERIGFPQSKGL